METNFYYNMRWKKKGDFKNVSINQLYFIVVYISHINNNTAYNNV